ncbi:hypothetical protein RO3G_15637 [Rhizopus delemar RA 99-880]|uniref:Uncharacterized protein n=1 Tax=Rhizopus delemar (strain RA 99-880 / ATCC MYA-4621 / FGSC 9543 / NRRL 43880) TaxID=246409 RepID=I1CR46_RHIO9|nr:hypothetical protein RO3G_15637 [Rhizopus delemar RA 99-880]|eukprot:EIE90926.1 hypothetical protein RO3G_15637 [Rhizopus delemar RA 99-880]
MDSKGYRLTLPSSENGWLNRQDHEQLTAYLNEKNDKQEDRASEILENIQQVKSVTESIVMEQQEEKKEMIKDDKKPIEFLREWIWFPMIYTREKTISWSDIPPSHKKMTSQWKEHVECDSKAQFESNRLFKDMTEIKFDIHGKFANHNDLNKLQTWMEKKGCGKAFDYLFECRET